MLFTKFKNKLANKIAIAGLLLISYFPTTLTTSLFSCSQEKKTPSAEGTEMPKPQLPSDPKRDILQTYPDYNTNLEAYGFIEVYCPETKKWQNKTSIIGLQKDYFEMLYKGYNEVREAFYQDIEQGLIKATNTTDRSLLKDLADKIAYSWTDDKGGYELNVAYFGYVKNEETNTEIMQLLLDGYQIAASPEANKPTCYIKQNVDNTYVILNAIINQGF